MEQQLLPITIEMRALAHMEKGVEVIEAVKLAFEEEENMLWLAAKGVDMKTGQYRPDVKEAIQSHICETVYNRLRSK